MYAVVRPLAIDSCTSDHPTGPFACFVTPGVKRMGFVIFLAPSVFLALSVGAVQAGTYNSRALAPEVLVRANEWALVRPRITVEELIALDRLPAWL
jgi:hypothetical protein